MAEYPPVLKIPAAQRQRYEDIKNVFVSRFGEAPSFYARASGRVNLIGEHIDYCGYSVLPMAIEQDIVIATSVNDSDKIILSNTQKKYKDFECSTKDFAIDKNNPIWHKYLLCGIKGIMEKANIPCPKGMKCVVDGIVPPCAGLSSSSALVCCAGLVTMHANNERISKVTLAETCAICERYIGTQGGGMDQSISFLAEQGTAKLIEFNPLKATDVSLPIGAVFVISNSCVEMNKASTSFFNIRVVECRLASQVIAKAKGISWRETKVLGKLQKALDISLDAMLEVVKATLHPEPYTKEEVCTILEVTADELASTSLSENTLTVESFKLFDRATHVFSEANRVIEFKKTCDESPEGALWKLGDLMNASHASCRDLYECSCPDLDRLVNICVQSGALGSRLTGAGWGGCAVSMVPENRLDEFLNKVKDAYYADKPDRVIEGLFASQPGRGAAIYVE